MAGQCATITLTRAISVAEGVFAPGHLGELTQYIPFELVDDVLDQTRTFQQRLRKLPSRVGVYFVLALALFPSLGYARVWDKLTAGLSGLRPWCPSEKALRDLRRRLGSAPLKLLFETVAGPVAQSRTPGVRYRRWRTVAFDGCGSIKVPDQPRVRDWLGKLRRHWGWGGYPMVRLMALCETGTRALLGAVFGPTTTGEIGYAERLLHLLSRDMLLLADRGFDSDDFLAKAADTGAQLLVRLQSRRAPAVLDVLPDGTYLTIIGGVKLRINEAQVTITTRDGRRIGDRYRLATTLLDHRADPAAALVALYPERWEVESAFYALRHTLLNGLVLRSCDRFGLEQELWGQLIVYQVLRRAMTDAVESVPGTDPDRAGFTIALEAARDQIINAGGVLPDDTYAAGSSVIGRAVLGALLPKRRARVSAHKVKCAMSRYPAKPDSPEERPPTSMDITRLDVAIHQMHPAAAQPQPGPAAQHAAPTGKGRRDRTVQLLRSDPDRAWHPREIAEGLDISHYRSLCAQLGHWVKEGLLRKVGRGAYALTPAWTSQPDLKSPTTA
ncbi:IS4 family transposase [Streptomyces sp. NPDC051917]|uniref:IS4 family transposase n=1 Tax=Streptomyces sp. NPDC051917 TaxID=3154754 RepID=UPI00344C2B8A